VGAADDSGQARLGGGAGGKSAVRVILAVVKSGGVEPVEAAGEFEDEFAAGQAFGFEFAVGLEQGRQGLFGLTEKDKVAEVGDGFAGVGEGPAGEDEGFVVVAVEAAEGDAGEVEEVEEVGVAQLVL
jgi:hypothetical protein